MPLILQNFCGRKFKRMMLHGMTRSHHLSIPSDRTFNSQSTPEIEKFVFIRRRFCSFTCTQKMMKEVNFKKWKRKKKTCPCIGNTYVYIIALPFVPAWHDSNFSGISMIEIYETSKQSSSAFLSKLVKYVV